MSTPQILVIEHEAKCPPALVGEWLADSGCALDVCRPWAGDELPALGEYDGLLVLGGTMGAHDDEVHHWLGPVKELIREAAASEVPTIGICLGHQLVAVALGGDVAVNPRGQQLGVLDVGWLPAADDDRLVGPTTGPTVECRGIHWNNDIVTDLPEGAELLATAGGAVQVARFAPTVWGVQLHPEADEHVVGAWADGDREVHLEQGIDQDALLAEITAARAELDRAWQPVFERFTELTRS